MKNIITVAKKELLSYFNNPTAYIVVAAFLLLWEFLFFRNAFLVGSASLRGLFEFLPWILIIVVPALTMGSLAEEKSDGTLEFLLTRPLNQFELVAGKFFGILFFFAFSLLFVFPLAWSFGRFGNLDWGEVFSQYAASVLMSSVLVSIGIFLSSLLSTQISAFLVSSIASFFLIISGTELISSHLPLFLAPFLEQLSLNSHFSSMSRGVIDARDLRYFISLSGVFLAFTYLNLIKNKYGNKKSVYRNYQIAFSLLLGIVVLSNVIGARIPGRIDLTQGKIYTLSPSTRDIVENLPDIVNISLYSSDKLPAQLQPVLRETKDILEDYRTVSKGKIKVAYKNPSSDTEAADEAVSLGVQPMRFNVVSQEEFQVKEGYLGLAVSYAGEHEAIPFVQNISDLEYQLSSFLRKLTKENKPKVGFLSGHGEKNLYSDYRIISEELGKQFEVKVVAAETEEKEPDKAGSKKEEVVAPVKKLSIPEDIKTLVIAGGTEEFSEAEKKVLSEFFSQGGSALFLVDGTTISPQTMSVSANGKNLAEYLKDLTGVEVKKDLAYDVKSNETVTFGGGAARYVLPYPFWIRAQRAEGKSPITRKIDNLVMPWASTLEISQDKLQEKGFQKDELFSTTESAGVQTASFNIAPDQKVSGQKLSKKLLVAAIFPAQGSEIESRFVIAGDSDFLSDQFVQNNPANFSFAVESLSWLTQEPAISQIGIKDLSEKKLSFQNNTEPSLLKFGNLAFVFLLTSGYGTWRLSQRKKMKDLVYSE